MGKATHSTARGPLGSLVWALNRLTIGFVAAGLATVVCSTGRPPTLDAGIKAIQPLPGKRSLVYGTMRGTWGPLRRGFGQMIGRVSLDLLTADGRYLTIARCIEEPEWQGVLWPLNWWRTEVWFSELLPELSGFESIRVRLEDRLGNERVSDPYPLRGGPGSAELVPDDVRWLALPAIAISPSSAPVDADQVALESPRR